jgi:hypothetical protein
MLGLFAGCCLIDILREIEGGGRGVGISAV